MVRKIYNKIIILKLIETHFYAVTDNLKKIRKLKFSFIKSFEKNETENYSKIFIKISCRK